MFITHKKGLSYPAPTLLYGYGGFDISLTPSFSISVAAWLRLGGVFAVACLRAGGEYGKEWHEGGKKLNKQNVFDDFISVLRLEMRPEIHLRIEIRPEIQLRPVFAAT